MNWLFFKNINLTLKIKSTWCACISHTQWEGLALFCIIAICNDERAFLNTTLICEHKTERWGEVWDSIKVVNSLWVLLWECWGSIGVYTKSCMTFIYSSWLYHNCIAYASFMFSLCLSLGVYLLSILISCFFLLFWFSVHIFKLLV